MPLYEFECQKCHHRFEKIQSFTDGDPSCPKCGGTVERLLHAPAVQFKGSGWYVTDYAKSGSAAKSESVKSESKTSDKSDSSSAAKTESKSESKSETKSSSSKKEEK